MPKTIVITGAAGNLGRKLRSHLATGADYHLHLLDIAPGGDPDVRACDLTIYDEAWAGTFAGADAIAYLVGLPAGEMSWPRLTRPYVDALLNVYLAAARHGVPRVVFASTVWTMASQRFGEGPITAEPLADPGDNAYGAAKLFGERVGKTFFDSYGISTVALRIGACREGENRFSRSPPIADWNQNCWLSNRDFCQGMEKALTAEGTGFSVVNLVSGNPGSRWTQDEATQAMGYVPQDGERAVTGRLGLRTRIARLTQETLPNLVRGLAPRDW